jgi:uncharacterized protein
MQIELASLEGSENKFVHLYEPGELVLNDERVRLIESPEVSGRIIRPGRGVKVNGRISGCVEVECDRCLKLIRMPIATEFKLEYVTTEEYQTFHAAELREEELTLSVFDGEVIDIDEMVREQVLLAVPSHVLCQTNCKGFCPVCGVDKNLVDCSCEVSGIDLRWAALKELVKGE